MLLAGTGARTPGGPVNISPGCPPGGSTSLPVTVEFGPGQLAGFKDFALIAKVLADRQYPAIRATTTVQIGLPDLELIPDVQLGPTPTGPDVIITAAVTNKDTRPRTLRLELTAKDTPSQHLPISYHSAHIHQHSFDGPS